MPVAYPINAPTGNVSSVEIRAVTADAVSESPFTYKQQVQRYPGQRWELDISTMPMERAQSAVWIAFLTRLRGMTGTFLMGDNRYTNPRGAAQRYTDLDSIQVAANISRTHDLPLLIDFNPNNIPPPIDRTGWLLAGDFVQISTGAATKLHRLTTDMDIAPAAGGQDYQFTTTAEVWPASNAAILTVVTPFEPKGHWRLTAGEAVWNSDGAGKATVAFGAVEVI